MRTKFRNYPKLIQWSDEDRCFIGSIRNLCGNCCHGDHPWEVHLLLLEIEESWMEIYGEMGEPLPPITTFPVKNGRWE